MMYRIELTGEEIDEMHQFVVDLDLHEGFNSIPRNKLLEVYHYLQGLLYHNRTSLHLMTRIRVIAHLETVSL